MIHFNIYRFVGVCRLFQQQLFLVKKLVKKDKKKSPQGTPKNFFPQLIIKFCSIEIPVQTLRLWLTMNAGAAYENQRAY